ncbi:MAG: zinc ribbon domain-containing protein [Dehalococcoidia bacterium]
MPIYEYECSSCGSRFDRRQRFDEEPIATCPECRSKARRIIHSVPVLFKGSGFYSTDHGRGTRHNPGPNHEDTESKAEAKSEDKADTKSATKTKTEPEKSG